jgi:hypothetical protein
MIDRSGETESASAHCGDVAFRFAFDKVSGSQSGLLVDIVEHPRASNDIRRDPSQWGSLFDERSHQRCLSASSRTDEQRRSIGISTSSFESGDKIVKKALPTCEDERNRTEYGGEWVLWGHYNPIDEGVELTVAL